MDVALGVLLGLALAASLAAGWRLVRAPRVQDPSSSAMQGAVHAATSLLPQLRRGLDPGSAAAAPHQRTLTGAGAIALADSERLLAITGPAPITTARVTRWPPSRARCATTACAWSRGCTATSPAARCARRSSHR